MGEVYLAWDSELERPVAVKVLPQVVAADTTRIERFIREAKAASALNHPNILTVYDAGHSDGMRFIVTEYIEGHVLRTKIAQGSLDVRTTLDIGMQIASALTEAHRAGIVHRDIKPENVMLRPSGAVKLLDFGLAKLTQGPVFDDDGATRSESRRAPSATRAGMMLGTYGYMAPEQLRGSDVDTRADLFSLGVLIYELVSGRRPFGGVTTTDVIVAILKEDPQPLSRVAPDVPPELDRIVAKLLEKEPDRRYQAAQDLLGDLKHLNRSLDAPLPATPTRRARIAIVAGFTAVILATAAYLVWDRNRHTAGLPQLTIRPITSFPSVERTVAFSPDGRQVAFTWVGAGVPNFDIYVQFIDAGAPLRLTTSTGRDMSPAWSPDGRYVAFLRATGDDKGFFIVPALGGAERKLASAYGWRLSGVMPHAVDWSPDGGTLAVVDKEAEADPWTIYLLSVDSGQRRKLTSPPASSTGDHRVAFSPDGKRVAFVRVAKTTEIYTQSVDAREPVRVASNVEDVAGLGWTPNGRELLFSSAKLERSELWRVPVTGGVPIRVPELGGGAQEFSIARDGGRIAFARVGFDSDIFRLDADPQSAAGGFLPPQLFVSSTRIDSAARFSPDGTHVVFRSQRSGHDENWVCSSTGDAPMPLTNFNGPEVGYPAWSPDGKQIAFIGVVGGRSHLYTINSAGGQPRIVFADEGDAEFSEWSPDGRWIYFTSRRTGIYEIWREPVEGGQPEQITTGGGSSPRFVGQDMYYAREFGTSTTLWKLASGGVPTKVFDTPVFYDSWTATDRGIYYIDRDPIQIRFFDPVTAKITTIAPLGPPRPNQLVTRLDVSSDHRSILYTDRVRLDVDLMLAEGFR